jgi:hypothetical protein
VKGVQDDAEIVVLADVPPVAAHVVGDDARRLTVAAPGGDVEVLVVEQNPHEGRLRRELPLLRILLDEIGDCRQRAIDRLVEYRVDMRRFGDPHRAHGDAAFLVPHFHRRKRPGSVGEILRPRGFWQTKRQRANQHESGQRTYASGAAGNVERHVR